MTEQISKAEQNRLWQELYDTEKKLYEFARKQIILRSETDFLFEFTQLEFAGTKIEKPPRYIRCIMLLDTKKKQSQFLGLYSDLLHDHRVALDASTKPDGKRPTRHPDRFPVVFHEYVSQINLTVNKAFQSQKLDPDSWLLAFRDSDVEVVNEKAALLQQKGLDIEIERIPYGWFNLYVENKSLMAYAGSDQLQYRLYTGSQYFARVRQGDNVQAKRMKYGFMVLMQESPCEIYDTVPQKQRKDKHPDSALIEMPFEIIGSIYDLNKCQ